MNRKTEDPWLWERLVSFENLLSAYKKAAKGRRSRISVAGFEYTKIRTHPCAAGPCNPCPKIIVAQDSILRHLENAP